MQMDVVDLAETVHRVTLAGRPDATGVERVGTRFTALLAGTPKHAIMDISEVGFFGSLAIRMLLSTARVMSRRERRMVIVGVQPQVSEVLEAISLGSVIPIAATPDEAHQLLAA